MAATSVYPHMCIYVCILAKSLAYNLDTRSPVVHTGVNGTYFGYSVAMHRSAGNDMLLVGAPEDESGIPLSGAFYTCPVTPFHAPGNCIKMSQENALPNEDVTRQWLGATVRSEGTDGTIMACAPFYKSLNFSRIQPSGKCIIYNNGDTETKTPCVPTVEEDATYTKGSHCLAGTSAEINQNRYVIGGPGSFAAQGSVFTVDESGSFIVTPEGSGETDGDYQGFSVAFGKFSNSAEQDVVTGVPRASYLLGLVKIYTSSLLFLTEFTGTQAASHFGASVAASDLNADGFDDLIVGAPNYWNKMSHQLDVGQVSIFYQTSLGVFDMSPTYLTGKVERGRFGFVVTALGDIDDDGVNDLAVSAPYDGSGAVYIFNGRAQAEIISKPSQVLRPSDFTGNIPMERFGFATSGNQDSDGNLYTDLLVGAYESDVAVLIRTKPVIRPDITISFTSAGVNLTSRTLNLGDQLYSPFYGKACIGYDGLGTNESYDFNIKLTLDAKKHTSRALFYNNSARVLNDDAISIEKNGAGYCSYFVAYLVNQVIDKVSQIVLQVSIDVIQDEASLQPGEILHVLDAHKKVEDAGIPIFVDCINDGCTPNLVLSVKSDKSTLYFGDSTQVALTVIVENEADEAFGAQLHAFVPEEVKYVSYKRIESDIAISCERRTDPAGALCRIGNPLPKKSKVVLQLNFEIASVPGDRKMLHMQLKANSTSEEATEVLEDNNVTVSLNLEPKVGVMLEGSANTYEVIFNDTKEVLSQEQYEKASEVGDEVVHTYWVRNIGPANIESATLTVSWPMKIVHDDLKYLLYLTSTSLNNGGYCEVEGGENPENLQLRDVESATRRKRSINSTSPDTSNKADCSEGYEGCITITCPLRDLTNDASNTILTVKSRLWIDNLDQGDDPNIWKIVSNATLTVNRIPYITQPSKLPQETASLELTAVPFTLIKTPGVPLWAIVLSIVIGVALLVIIIIILIKCGFFRRKRLDLSKTKSQHQADDDDDDMNTDDLDLE